MTVRHPSAPVIMVTAGPDADALRRGRGVLRIGITGHINLTPGSEAVVYRGLIRTLRALADRPVHGITCLAGGSDQLFARAILSVDGTYEVILPARDYRDRAIEPGNRPRFDELLARATEVRHGGFARSGDAAFAAANVDLVRRCDLLMAVWDGVPRSTVGGTAEAVALALADGTPVLRIWPRGAHRAS